MPRYQAFLAEATTTLEKHGFFKFRFKCLFPQGYFCLRNGQHRDWETCKRARHPFSPHHAFAEDDGGFSLSLLLNRSTQVRPRLVTSWLSLFVLSLSSIGLFPHALTMPVIVRTLRARSKIVSVSVSRYSSLFSRSWLFDTFRQLAELIESKSCQAQYDTLASASLAFVFSSVRLTLGPAKVVERL